MRVTVLSILLLCGATASAQDHYALEILAPRDDLPADHRMTRAYPGVPWEIRVAAVGGDAPYTYTLSGAPAAMTIVAGPCTTSGLTCTAGTITWPSPDATDASITVTVTDRDGDPVSETFGVTVSTAGFRWIDATSGNNSNNGILVADGGTGPVQTIAGMSAVDTGSSIWYFRSGTYTFAGITASGAGDASRVDFEHDAAGGGNSTMWLCYPGDVCTFDVRYPDVDPAPYARFTSDYAYVHGFTIRRDKIKAFEWTPISANGSGIWYENTFQEGGPGAVGSNAAFIMTSSNSYAFLAQLVVQNNTLGSADHNALKLYALNRTLIESSEFASGNAGMDVKSVIAQYTIRANIFTSCDDFCIAGNMDEQAAQVGVQTQGEVCYNYFNGCGTAGCIYYAEGFPRDPGEGFGPLFAYRNTFNNGANPAVQARDVTSAEGDLSLVQNVLISATTASGSCPAKVLCTTVSDFTKIVKTNNLDGVSGDGIIAANGDLQGAYLTDHGPASATPKGHMLVGAAATLTYRLRFRVAASDMMSGHPRHRPQFRAEADGAQAVPYAGDAGLDDSAITQRTPRAHTIVRIDCGTVADLEAAVLQQSRHNARREVEEVLILEADERKARRHVAGHIPPMLPVLQGFNRVAIRRPREERGIRMAHHENPAASQQPSNCLQDTDGISQVFDDVQEQHGIVAVGRQRQILHAANVQAPVEHGPVRRVGELDAFRRQAARFEPREEVARAAADLEDARELRPMRRHEPIDMRHQDRIGVRRVGVRVEVVDRVQVVRMRSRVEIAKPALLAFHDPQAIGEAQVLRQVADPLLGDDARKCRHTTDRARRLDRPEVHWRLSNLEQARFWRLRMRACDGVRRVGEGRHEGSDEKCTPQPRPHGETLALSAGASNGRTSCVHTDAQKGAA